MYSPHHTHTEEGTTSPMEQRAYLFDPCQRRNGIQKQLASLSSCPCPGAHLLALGMIYPSSYPPNPSKDAPQAQGQTQDNSRQNCWDQLGDKPAERGAALHGARGPNPSTS